MKFGNIAASSNGEGWLTLTWDVLKCSMDNGGQQRQPGLTLTWDVLKCLKTNINLLYFKWLTLTWDVLKYARGEATENSDID